MKVNIKISNNLSDLSTYIKVDLYKTDEAYKGYTINEGDILSCATIITDISPKNIVNIIEDSINKCFKFMEK
jgi:hypothetical protein